MIVANPVSDFNNFYTGIGLINSSASNNPGFTKVNGFCLVLSARNNDLSTGLQVAFSLDNYITPKIRYCANSTWSSWKDINIDNATNASIANYIKAISSNNISFNWTGSVLEVIIDGTKVINIARNC